MSPEEITLLKQIKNLLEINNKLLYKIYEKEDKDGIHPKRQFARNSQ